MSELVICYIFMALVVMCIGTILISFVYELFVEIYRKIALRYEITREVAEVVDKQYDSNIIMNVATKMYDTFEEFNVYILYDGEKYCFDDEDLYERVEIGDTIRISVHKGFNSQGQLKHTHLSIEE